MCNGTSDLNGLISDTVVRGDAGDRCDICTIAFGTRGGRDCLPI